MTSGIQGLALLKTTQVNFSLTACLFGSAPKYHSIFLFLEQEWAIYIPALDICKHDHALLEFVI